MPNYRRVFIPGGTWFFTVNLLERDRTLLVDQIRELRHAVFRVKRRYPFRMEAMVVLPDHLHAIWTLPPGDSSFPLRWRLIRGAFSRTIAKDERRSEVRIRRGERGIWQRRYWEHSIRDQNDFNRHVAYCYFNPVKHGYVSSPAAWAHSTFHRDVRCGRQQPDIDQSLFANDPDFVGRD
jgi:putative transposase